MSVTSELCIGGMTCASCAAHVAAALREVPGVEDASVNLATERARVVHAAEVPVAALIGAVEGAGYEAGAPGAQDDAARRRDAELARQRRLLLLAVLLTIPEAVLAMAVADFAGKVWIEALLALPVWGVVGWEFHRGALAGLRSGNFSMDTLVSLGSTAAMLLSFYLAATGSAPYFESAAAIVTLVFAGRVLESGARAKSDRAVRELLALRPETARRRRNGTLEAIAIDDVHIGDELEVLAGERVPVDGTVVEGESTIDRSLLTGEPMPVDVRAGERVEQGTINGDGALLVRADAVGAGTALARIVEAVQRAQGSAPPIARLADRAAGVFVPVVLVLAALTAIGWLFTGHSWVTALVSAVAVLVVACPCALGLATPTAVIAGVGNAARRGILFRDASTLEVVAAARLALFDKTGTLTLGKPAVIGVDAYGGATAADVLHLAAAVERRSTHPLARAIVAAAASPAEESAALDVRTVRGGGATGVLDGARIDVGSASFLASNGIALQDGGAQETRVYVARDGRAVGAIVLADEPRPTAAAAIARLRALGVASAIVSGDAAAPTRRLAELLGVERFDAGVSPEGKAELVEAWRRAQRGPVLFVGDGINDAPALAAADAGFAMGDASAVALETAGAAILSNDPLAVCEAVAVARATVATIRVNLFWAFAYNVALVPLAALGIVQPMLAAAAMGASSLFVVGNSLLLSRRGAAQPVHDRDA